MAVLPLCTGCLTDPRRDTNARRRALAAAGPRGPVLHIRVTGDPRMFLAAVSTLALDDLVRELEAD
jgi:hypothetical protein